MRHMQTTLSCLRRLKRALLPYLYERYDLLIAASEEAKRNLATAFDLPPERIAVTGYPRNDALTGAAVSARCGDTVPFHRADHKLVIGYVPTFRDRTKIDLLADYRFDPRDVSRFLDERDGILWIKGHYADRGACPAHEKGTVNRVIFLSDSECPDIYPLLRHTDILITDYSSVYFDFLLLNRPIIFAPFDLEEYTQRDRGLYYRYETVTPGPKARDWPEVLALVEQVLEADEFWTQQRETICKRFNEFQDAGSSRRVYEAIIGLLHSARPGWTPLRGC